MSTVNTPVPRRRNKQSKATKHCAQIKHDLEAELHRLQGTNALLIATQVAANRNADLDASDAGRSDHGADRQHIQTLDRLSVRLDWEVSP